MKEDRFFDIGYLARGTARQQEAYSVLEELEIFKVLKIYNPTLVGTIPISIDIEGSDLDLICEVYDLDEFGAKVDENFEYFDAYHREKVEVEGVKAFIGSFYYKDFEVEIFGQPRAVDEQTAFRHMIAEKKLLDIGGEEAKKEIIKLKKAGYKTEPAFAEYFNIEGDPYERLYELSEYTEEELKEIFS